MVERPFPYKLHVTISKHIVSTYCQKALFLFRLSKGHFPRRIVTLAKFSFSWTSPIKPCFYLECVEWCVIKQLCDVFPRNQPLKIYLINFPLIPTSILSKCLKSVITAKGYNQQLKRSVIIIVRVICSVSSLKLHASWNRILPRSLEMASYSLHLLFLLIIAHLIFY